jgi:hypothetical protein
MEVVGLAPIHTQWRCIMALLTGKVKSMRVVEGKYKTGKRQGEDWEFLSMEIIDVASGMIWSCQLPSEAEKYRDVAQDNLVGHRVKVTVMGQSASERELQDGRKVMQIRSQVTNVRDLGLPHDDEE